MSRRRSSSDSDARLAYGRDPRPVEDVVGIAPADAGHGLLVAEQGVHPAAVVAGHHHGLELVRQRLRAEGGQRPVVTGRQHPPPRLALGAELLHQHGRAALEPQPHHAELGPGGLGRVLEVDPSTLGQVYEQAVPAVELEDDELPAPAHGVEAAADQLLGGHLERLQPRELQRGRRFQRRPPDGPFEPLGEGLDLGKLGHQARVRPPEEIRGTDAERRDQVAKWPPVQSVHAPGSRRPGRKVVAGAGVVPPLPGASHHPPARLTRSSLCRR